MNYGIARRLLSCAMLSILMLPSAGEVMAQEATQFVNGHWYTGTGFERRSFYSVDGVLRESWDGAATTVDLGGGWVLPGFGDAHSHHIGNDDVNAESERFLANGVFYVANPNSIASRTHAAREALHSATTVDARFANGGLTSGGGHPIQIFEGGSDSARMRGDAYEVIDDVQMLDERWPDIVSKHPDFVKIYLERSEYHAARKNDPAYFGKRGLDPQLIPAIVERAHAANLRVAAHVTSQYDFHVAVESGVDEIAHLPLEPITEADAQLAATHGTTVVTTVLSHRPSDGVDDLDGLHRSNIEMLRAAGVALVLGTDSQASVIDEALKLHSIGALDANTLVRMLTHDTPRWIFPGRNIGTFADGAEASFVILESNPLDDLTALRKIDARYKSGQKIELKAAENKLPGIGQKLAHTVMAQGADAAIAEYHRLRSEESDAWDFSEGQLNALGYAVMNHGKTAEALAIFKLNCEQFPESSNAWDSLGDAYAQLGDVEKARQSYGRAVELDPHNAGSRDKLEKLQ